MLPVERGQKRVVNREQSRAAAPTSHLLRGAGDVWDAQSAVTKEVPHDVEITGAP